MISDVIFNFSLFRAVYLFSPISVSSDPTDFVAGVFLVPFPKLRILPTLWWVIGVVSIVIISIPDSIELSRINQAFLGSLMIY